MIARLLGTMRRIATDRLAVGSAIMAGAIVFGNALSFLALPFLARLYTPEAFGVFGFVISWITILGVLMTLRFESIIPITNSIPAAAALARRSTNRAFFFTLLLVLALAAATAAGAIQGSVGPIELLTGIGGAFAASYFAIGRSLHQRLDRYSIIASSTIVRSVVFAGGALLLAFLPDRFGLSGGAALLLASMASFLVPAAIYHLTVDGLFRASLRPGRALTDSESNFSDAALNKVSLTFVLSQISFQFPLWMAMLLFGSAATGWVTMSYRLAMFPSDILCGSVALVLARRIADSISHHPERIAADRRVFALFLIANFLLFGFLGLLIWVGAGPLLGPEWAEAAPVMGLLAALGLSFTIQPSVIQVFSLLKREREILAITIAHVALMLLGAAAVRIFDADLLSAAIGLMVLEVLLSIALTYFALLMTKTISGQTGISDR
jgi:O-antigen/teichoic acid export membrane protein